MKEFDTGDRFLGKRVIADRTGNITLILRNKYMADSYNIKKKEKFHILDIQKVFISKPKMFSAGTVYFSRTGENVIKDVQAESSGLVYTNTDEDNINELLLLLKEINEELVIEGLELSEELKELIEEKRNERIFKCPQCGSTNLQYAGNDRKNFSVGKAAAGAALTGGVGLLAGFVGKKGKDKWYCQDCGTVFNKKE